MLPIRWEPFRELSTLHKEIDELFRRTFGGIREPEGEAMNLMSPKVNTFVKDEVYHVEAELPGIERKDLDVSIDGNILTLKGERRTKQETRHQDFLMQESSYGSFLRRLVLPDGVNADKVHAAYEDGILTITMPLEKKLMTGRKVMIEGGTGKSEGKKVH